MALHKLERRNYGGKSPVSIKYQNLHSFKEGLILLCQSIFETRRITHLHGSAHFTTNLRTLSVRKPLFSERKLLFAFAECKPSINRVIITLELTKKKTVLNRVKRRL